MTRLFVFLWILLNLPAMGEVTGKHFDGLRLRENKGMVTALEAPLFAVPDRTSPVIQYVRKGEEIYIHPAEFQRDRYEETIEEDEQSLLEFREEYVERFPDPLFANPADVYVPAPGSDYYKTLSASGREAYILKEHVFLLYNDLRELEQEIPNPDPTDYRIAEPLPEGYPFKQVTGYRGYFSIGLGIPTYPAYSYNSRIDDTGYDFLKDFHFVWLKNPDIGLSPRFFLGALAAVSSSELVYQLKDRRSTERRLSLSIGPMAAYDLWEGGDYRFNIAGSLQVVLYDNLEITQSAPANSSFAVKKDIRNFSSWHLSPQFSGSLQKKKFFYLLDLVAGIDVNWSLPQTYSTSEGAENPSWWSGEEFDRPSSLQMTYFLGIQKDY